MTRCPLPAPKMLVFLSGDWCLPSGPHTEAPVRCGGRAITRGVCGRTRAPVSGAGATDTLSILGDARVFVVVFVTVRAVRFAPIAVVLPCGVDAGCDYFEVFWVDAVPLPAQVVELHSFGDELVVVVLPQDSVDDSFGVAGSPLSEGVAVFVELSCP